jgi:hypothetical protein
MRKGVGERQTAQGRQVEFIGMVVYVPCCSRCQAAIVGRARLLAVALVVGMIGGLGGGVLIGCRADGGVKPIAVGAFAGLVAGAFVGCALAWGAALATRGRVRGLRSELEYAGVKGLLAEGWTPVGSTL